MVGTEMQSTAKSQLYQLSNEFNLSNETIMTTGINALVRLLLEQSKADLKAGLNTAGFVSGYRGSPLGGLDLALLRNKRLLDENRIEFLPAVNEDLGLTAVFGSQIAHLFPKPKFDGVFSMWYGKAPGVDRSGDALKHANFAGVGHMGGVLAVAGDDPISKSSTIPSHSEPMFFHAQAPVIYPGSVQDIIDLGRLGFELSRFSGLIIGFKIVTDIADAVATIVVGDKEIKFPEFDYEGQPWQHTQQQTLLPPYSLNIEKEINHGRLEAAKMFAYANGIDQITIKGSDDSKGIIAAGKTYFDLMEALSLLGYDEQKLNESGIRILKMGMVYPMDHRIIEDFMQGLSEILVIEEKRSFIELQLKEILYDFKQDISIFGKFDEKGEFLVKSHGELVVEDIMKVLEKQFGMKYKGETYEDEMVALNVLDQIDANRIPYYCSGCPHNVSTTVPSGAIGIGGIGCHALVVLMDRDTKGLMQMGGEGAQWVGATRFSDNEHVFQNLGDGTLFHSGSLAIRQAVAANTRITYKILHNGVVAMTGAQMADGSMPLPELTRALEAEGVKGIIVCGPKVKDYPRRLKWAKNVKIWHRDRFEEAQLELAKVDGVTVLIYDQECAANLRRLRKRAKAAIPYQQVFINEAICEGCGDCGDKSNCLSVFPVQTEFGRKTQIHQSSCNRDYTCLKGDCPAFITIEQNGKPLKEHYIDELLNQLDAEEIPESELIVPEEPNIYMTGIGGTGVVTVTRILATASMLDGKFSTNLDQTGMSQKGGPVVAHLKIRNDPTEISNRVPDSMADSYIVFDLLSGTTEKNLKKADHKRTVAISSISKIPTGKMVSNIHEYYPQDQLLKSRLEIFTRKKQNFYLDSANLAENLLGSFMYANMITIGAAFQRGVIPISFDSILNAIELNGVAVLANQRALKIGRMLVHNPDWINNFDITRWGDWAIEPHVSEEARKMINGIKGSDELHRLLERRVPELIDYQDEDYAQEYADFVKWVVYREKKLNRGSELSETVARYLYKLMAYKDEYEVSRLYLKNEFKDAIEHQFGLNAKVSYMLHPPFLRALGWKKKIRFGSWFIHAYKLLYRMRKIRGTRWDIFGYAKLRKRERSLISEYKDLIYNELEGITEEQLARYNTIIQVAELPEMIRGYEHVKERNIDTYEEQLEKLTRSL